MISSYKKQKMLSEKEKKGKAKQIIDSLESTKEKILNTTNDNDSTTLNLVEDFLASIKNMVNDFISPEFEISKEEYESLMKLKRLIEEHYPDSKEKYYKLIPKDNEEIKLLSILRRYTALKKNEFIDQLFEGNLSKNKKKFVKK